VPQGRVNALKGGREGADVGISRRRAPVGPPGGAPGQEHYHQQPQSQYSPTSLRHGVFLRWSGQILHDPAHSLFHFLGHRRQSGIVATPFAPEEPRFG